MEYPYRVDPEFSVDINEEEKLLGPINGRNSSSTEEELRQIERLKFELWKKTSKGIKRFGGIAGTKNQNETKLN